MVVDGGDVVIQSIVFKWEIFRDVVNFSPFVHAQHTRTNLGGCPYLLNQIAFLNGFYVPEVLPFGFGILLANHGLKRGHAAGDQRFLP